MTDTRIIILRALNHLRTAHLPSYVALRMLLEAAAPERLEAIIDAVLVQTAVRKRDRILKLRRFKSRDGNHVDYRGYFVPSPSSALSDSYALACLHDGGVLRRSPDVFSYRPPPSQDYGRNFEHFADGYLERNRLVASALQSSDGLVALVTDIEKFYPSIDGDRAVQRLCAEIDRVGTLSHRQIRIALAAAKRAICVDTGGLRIGLEMSHALASLYLTGLDHELRSRFPGRYFRYVDDIVVVVPLGNEQEALNALDGQLEKLSLRRNPKKDAIAELEEWRGFVVAGRRSVGNSADCLRDLKFRIKLFLARNPQQAEQLSSALKKGGIYLPIEQLQHASGVSSWRQKVSDFVRGGWQVVHRYRFDNVGDVASAASQCKIEILQLLRAVMNSGVADGSGSVARRWKVQGARLAINRALYFADSDVLSEIIDFTDGVAELAEANAVCRALAGDFAMLVATPGPAVAAASQLIALRGSVVPDDVIALSFHEGAEVSADFQAHVSLRGLALPSIAAEGWSSDLRSLVEFGSGRSSGRDRISQYGEEISALRVNYSLGDAQAIARTRFMSAETIVLDALSLDSAYGS